MNQQYILKTVSAALQGARPDLPADDTSQLILRQARAAVNHGYTKFPWYRAAAQTIAREHGGIYVLIWDVVALTTSKVCEGVELEEASREAMLELQRELRREYDQARVPKILDLDQGQWENFILVELPAEDPHHISVEQLYELADDVMREVLDALADGASVRDVSERVGIARSTLRDRLKRLRDEYEQEVAHA